MRSLPIVRPWPAPSQSCLLPSASKRELSQLCDFAAFGSNPGALGAKAYAPAGLKRGAALVVVMHGCSQTAAAYDAGSGWSALAKRHRFALLFPEQRRANNAALCFNWFAPGDIRRGAGEAASIMQMITTSVEANDLDPSRIFITGLSAGGAMAAAMLALYPESFAGGAIMAGLPFGSASTMTEAVFRMRGYGSRTPAELCAALRSASAYHGDWPTVSIWHGSADHIVSPSNGEDLVTQWRGIHDLGETPSDEMSTGSFTLRRWRDTAGQIRVRHYNVRGMGHGVPVNAASSGPFMIDAGVSSTHLIAQTWQLAEKSNSTLTGKCSAPTQRRAHHRVRCSHTNRSSIRA